MIEKVRRIVEAAAEEGYWKYHILPVVKHAKELASKLGADEKTVELAALLHDIGRMRHGPKKHEVTGAAEAERILRGLGADAKVVEEVKHCVRTHRTREGAMPETLAARIVANADAMAHYDAIPRLFYWHATEKFEDVLGWVDKKVERDWHEKLTLPEARELVREKYEAIRVVLDATKEYV